MSSFFYAGPLVEETHQSLWKDPCLRVFQSRLLSHICLYFLAVNQANFLLMKGASQNFWTTASSLPFPLLLKSVLKSNSWPYSGFSLKEALEGHSAAFLRGDIQQKAFPRIYG